MSIHTIDMLFRQIHLHDSGSPTSTTSSARASVDSGETVVGSEYTAELPALKDGKDQRSTHGRWHSFCSTGVASDEQLVEQLMDTLFPHPQPDERLFHTYYTVATLDGAPAVPEWYRCPTAACTDRFRWFAELQAHWRQHPWNRRSVLLPVTAGGIRRLSFWQHKAVYLRSLMRRPSAADPAEPSDGRGTTAGQRREARHFQSKRGAAASDYGDVQLFGPSSYFVSPKAVSAEQLSVWEKARPPAAAVQ